jgi:hypothetical protein
MEEIDNAVVVTATASSKPANTNPNAGLAKNPSSKVREEGELSSSDDEAAVLSYKSLKLTCAFAIFFLFFFLCISVWSPGKQRKLEENAIFGFTEREVLLQCS